MTLPHRVVIDVNVIISGVITPGGAPEQIIKFIDSAIIVPLISPFLISELTRVFSREKFHRYLSPEGATLFIAALEQVAEAADDPELGPPLTRDPADEYLVALALSTKADALISGDRDLLSLQLPDLTVLSPRQLVDLHTNA